MKRQLLLIAAAVVPLSAAALAPMAADAVSKTSATGVAKTSCAAVPVSAPTGTKVVSVSAVAKPGGDFTFPTAYPPHPDITAVPAWCDINVVVTHPGANDTVHIKISLPQDATNWNGRFQATGGSAYLAGDISDSSIALISAVKAGYVGAATDAGVKTSTDASWGLNPDGSLNTALLTNFASRSVHDMAVIGKDMTDKFYQRPAAYSYFTGCSTGGRQGYAEAQNYPTDFQGILANAPAIDWNRFEIATLWSQAVYNEEKVAPTTCELNAFNSAVIAACDTLDGVKDGVIADPQECKWDARKLVGTTVVCDGKTLTITKALADAVDKIWAGPTTTSGKKLWFGQNKGSLFDFIDAYNSPFAVPALWAQYFVTKDPSFNPRTLTYASFKKLFNSATKQFDSIIGDNTPNLTTFAKSGGKLLTWQGQSDQLIPTQGTVYYREKVNAVYGGNAKVDNFYRLFLLPGVDHCGSETRRRRRRQSVLGSSLWNRPLLPLG